ncbi:uncharacterized protein BT62DRAFT_372701 [Guyanagaster necrorhizus]|uniref:Uncharacterized protein n=1 Tax=Guyanagaster necrorhizus TaxID=856835 RepID=A0A9P8APA7_9AGAR|nr:uncharacterized protein BT62DRAFT_372701 [Guyanagaster necrorhizus MCA 3950]KAG7442745.1 hypothetical protein BT62DRAFT_372701 [Guyanagaster necrorhizus MCA 3950]
MGRKENYTLHVVPPRPDNSHARAPAPNLSCSQLDRVTAKSTRTSSLGRPSRCPQFDVRALKAWSLTHSSPTPQSQAPFYDCADPLLSAPSRYTAGMETDILKMS